MRLITLLLTLVIIAGLVYYYQDNLGKPAPEKTVKQQNQEIIDQAKEQTEALQKALEKQEEKFRDLENQ